MKRIILASLVLAAPAVAQQAALPGAPVQSVTRAATAQTPGAVPKRAPINGVLVLYGNERCPTDAQGNEVIVCERRSAEEQYRVPKELREFQVTPQNESWAARAQGTMSEGVGVNSIGSCSTVGAGGQTGCFIQRANAATKERRAQAKADARVP